MEKNGKKSSNTDIRFIGTYYHTLEEKGRVSVPKAFRKNLKEGSIITRGLDGCLFIFTSSSWNKLIEKLSTLPISQKSARDFLRLLTYNAAPVQFDQLGRTRIPENLISLAKLKKNIVFAGALSRIEVWNKQEFHAYTQELEKSELQIAESLSELGI